MSTTHEHNAAGLRAIVADDERFICQILVRMLQRIGIDVVGVGETGEEAIQLYKEHRPDIVILDIAMPVKDGLEALKEILEMDPEAKVLMCTSFSSKQYIVEAVKLGAKGYLSKPFDLSKIREKLSRICEIPAATS